MTLDAVDVSFDQAMQLLVRVDYIVHQTVGCAYSVP